MASSLAAPDTPTPAPPKPRTVSDAHILGGGFAVLLFAPLAFGAGGPISLAILETASALLLGLWIRGRFTQDTIQLRDNPLFRPMLAFAALVALQLIFGITAYWHDTFTAALQYFVYASLTFLAVQCLQRSSQAKTLAVVLSTYGFAVASFALLQGLAPNGKIYWLRTPAHGGWIYGPFANHNSYAGLMELLVPIPLVFSLSRYARGRVRSTVAVGAAVMAATIFFSGSRGGMLAFLAELIVLAVVAIKLTKGSAVTTGIGVFAALMIGLLIWIGGAELTSRLATIRADTRQEVSGGVRWTINKDGLRMFAKKPVLGWGLGTFAHAYPEYRSFYTNFLINEAHDDYLQLLVETGAVGFAIMLWYLITFYRNALKKLTDFPNDINGAIALASVMACTGILVHSFVDFNLQVNSNAAFFYVLAALGASPQTVESRQRVRRARSLHPPTSELEANGDTVGQDTPL
jgi:O-antigen ligase